MAQGLTGLQARADVGQQGGERCHVAPSGGLVGLVDPELGLQVAEGAVKFVQFALVVFHQRLLLLRREPDIVRMLVGAWSR